MSTGELRPPSSNGRHVLTVSVQEYFHVGALDGAVLPKHWGRFESRLEATLEEILRLLERAGARATFFVLGWVAERQPELVRRIVDAGHEVASSGYAPRGPRDMVPMELRHDLRLSRDILESAGSGPILGYRCPRNWFRRRDLWALDVLAEEGYRYDSSVNPVLRRFASDPRRFDVHRHRHPAGDVGIWELPISTASILGIRLAISGGNYLRQFPHALMSRAVARWDRTKSTPLVFYFRPWELDPEQPRIHSLSFLSRLRHYRNLGRAREELEFYLSRYRFQSARDYLGLKAEDSRPRHANGQETVPFVEVGPDLPSPEGLPAATLVVPLYNEEDNVGYLYRTLLEVRQRLAATYRLHLCLVDDGSRDATWEELGKRFSALPDCTLFRHDTNRGVAAAILTGVRGAPTEIVCSIDCDCSYDPSVLAEMLPRIETADLVTASPYHPEGRVFNVPRWRLLLSKTLSRMYSALLKERFHTYTSCCRVYRKSAVARLELKHGGFLGVAETLIRLKLRGGRVIEHPAALESRIFGESKMKVVRTIWSHLGLLGKLAFRKGGLRDRSGRSSAAGDGSIRSTEPEAGPVPREPGETAEEGIDRRAREAQNG